MGVSLLRTAQSLLTGRTIDVHSLSAMDKMMILILFKFVYGHAEAFITELRKKIDETTTIFGYNVGAVWPAQCGSRLKHMERETEGYSALYTPLLPLRQFHLVWKITYLIRRPPLNVYYFHYARA